jgi:NAD(P)-dependent dehydrogenase (short-subunit alcohol dehydrogenase family)
MSEFPLAIVTGAAHRLGKAFALSLARQGYAILLHYHAGMQDAYDAAEEIRALERPVYLQPADLTQPEQIQALFDLVDGIPHPLKVLVNSAAVMERADARALSAEAWDASLDLNLRAPFLLAQSAAQRMTEGGLIVNVTDVAAQKAWSAFPAYTVSKAALESLTKVLARAFAPTVRVNAIAPGLVLHSDLVSSEQWDKMIARLPLQRAATLDEVTAALEYLLKNEYVTGQTLVVDGGYSLV